MSQRAKTSNSQPSASRNGHNVTNSHSNNQNTIRVRGARQHNLKNIDLELPRDRLIVFTGVSGSGKSSLAFDTIFAEGTAPLRRVSQRLRAPVFGTVGQTGCGRD